MVYWCKWCSGVLVNIQLCLEMMKSHFKTDAKCIWFSFCNRISHFLGQALSWNVKHAVTCLPLCAPGVMTSLQGSLLPPSAAWACACYPLVCLCASLLPPWGIVPSPRCRPLLQWLLHCTTLLPPCSSLISWLLVTRWEIALSVTRLVLSKLLPTHLGACPFAALLIVRQTNAC